MHLRLLHFSIGLLFLMSIPNSSTFAQQSKISCGQRVQLIRNSTPVFTVNQVNSTSGLGAKWTRPGFLIDKDTTNSASGSITALLGGNLTIAVKDPNAVYNAGNFAGFVMESGGLINISLLNTITISTYLGGTFQESSSASSLISISTALTSGAKEVGFHTNKSFDQIELSITTTGITLASYNVYYPVIRGYGSCTSPALVCNRSTPITFPTFPAVIDPVHTKVTGLLSIGAIANEANAIDNDSGTYATITTTASLAGTATFAIKDAVTDYDSGTYVGFDIENPALLDVSLFSNLSVRTYKDGIFVQQASGTGLLAGASLLSNGGRQTIGFATTNAFDEVELVVNQSVLTVDLGITKVYGAVFKKFCPGPALTCNTSTRINDTQYPVYISLEGTGLAGAVCLACSIDSLPNLLDNNNTNAARIDLTVGALSSGRIAVKDALTKYPAGTFAGFDVALEGLLNVSVLNNIIVTTYNDGIPKDSFSGPSLLTGVTTNLLGTTGRQTMGGVTTQPFNEVRIKVVQTAGVNLGITRIYNVVLTKFCAGTIACNSSYLLQAPDYPVYINAQRTGISGAVCSLCGVSDVNNVISPDSFDYAQIITTVNALAATGISVRDASFVYPAGVVAGFVIQNPNNILELSLFKRITINTYLNGTPQESVSGGNLLNLSALVLFINPAGGYYNVGFKTTLPYDEIQISADAIVGVAPVINVFSAFVDTRYADQVTTGILCPKPPIAEPDHTATLLNTPISGSLRTNDHDPRGTALTYNTTPAIPPAHGAVAIQPDGSFTYTPTIGFKGVDSFKYTVCNAATLCMDQWSYVSVFPPRTPGGTTNPPAAQNDFSQTIVNVSVTGNAYSNDGDADGDSLIYTPLNNPKHGTITLATNGQYLYTPDSSYVGSDTVKVQVCDKVMGGFCTTSLIFLSVAPTETGVSGNPPFAQDDITTTLVNTNVAGNVLKNDSDPEGDALTTTLLDQIPTGTGTLYFAPDGTYTFIPALNYSGSFPVRYKACDGGPNSCDTATLTITVQPVVGPDFTPLITFDSTSFSPSGNMRDFVLTISELKSIASNGSVVVSILKPSGFTITYAPTTTTSSVNMGTAVQNADWTITESDIFITCTLKPGATIIANGTSHIGFTIARNASTPHSTFQNITATIGAGTGGDSNTTNNQYTKNLNAQ